MSEGDQKIELTDEEVIAVINNEMACVAYANICDRDCSKCKLVLPDWKILAAYRIAILAIEERERRNSK